LEMWDLKKLPNYKIQILTQQNGNSDPCQKFRLFFFLCYVTCNVRITANVAPQKQENCLHKDVTPWGANQSWKSPKTFSCLLFPYLLSIMEINLSEIWDSWNIF
jgi:hypothetical protein